MTLLPSILVPLDGSHLSARALGCACWLAEKLGSRIHILSAVEQPLPARVALARLHVPEEHWRRIELHQGTALAEEAILEAIARHRAHLVVMTSRGQTAEGAEGEAARDSVGHVARAIIERSPVPVLLLPPSYREHQPWKSMLVPLSGEPACGEALGVALELAGALDLEAHVAHVADPAGEGIAAEARYADSKHYEYASRLEELMRRNAPHLDDDAFAKVTDLALVRGDVAAELLDLVETRHISLLVIGWHGCFTAGRANILKRLTRAVSCPVLLIKASPRAEFKLRVGVELG